jgi:hypothetical protein
MDINVGDTVVIRGTVEEVSSSLVTVRTPGNLAPLYVHAERITEVIPKPRLPKVGEIWEVKKARSSKRKVYYVDDTHVVYEDISKDECFFKRTIDYFLDQFQPET